MASCVLSASALIEFLFGEPGADFVASKLPDSLISCVNLAEVIAQALEKSIPVETIEHQLSRLPLTIVPFDAAMATLVATLKAPTRSFNLSFADRGCLALGLSRDLPVVTGDRSWSGAGLAVKIVLFR